MATVTTANPPAMRISLSIDGWSASINQSFLAHRRELSPNFGDGAAGQAAAVMG
jgi:hypothetical protein